ncbi:MAG: beta-ketoacyl-[acyl-carrier-protein] synthase family protein [Thermodesulfobacteriota bacterium]
MHRVAITGIGIVSCLGCDPLSVGEALRAGKSGIVVDERRRELGFRSPLTGAVRGFDPSTRLSRKQRKSMPDFAQQAYAAVLDALDLSGLSPENIANPETGLIFGCDSSCTANVEQVERLIRYGDTGSIGSGLTFQCITSTITINLNTLLKTRGACWTVSAACASGGHAVGQAADLIALGKQDRVICGGAQEINWESMCSFDGLGAFSLRVDEPEAACRPFDRHRDGLVPSGGAAALILERYDLALDRGARVLGEVKAYAFSSDGEHISVPGGDGISRAMQGALKTAGLTPFDIDYICAHATSTPAGDRAEAESITGLFGDHAPPVSSTKSMTGHELWMSGASQAVYCSIMADQGFIAPNINFEEPDEGSRGLNVLSEALERPPGIVLCNAAGFGGTNSCLILEFLESRMF